MSECPICDYEDSDYRTRFWEGQGREYEDAVERIAIKRLLPSSGELLMDLGAGFGRLADQYDGYQRVVLFDYSRSQLEHARSQLGDGRFIYVAGDFYKLPFVAGLFDTVNQVRVIHHAADAPAVFRQVRRVLRPVGTYLLEFANKQNLKAIGRYLLRRQDWSPFDPAPVEFVELNFDFHPAWIREQLSASELVPGQCLTVSHFRIDLLKRRIPIGWLIKLDSLAQQTGRWWQLTPSVFLRSRATADGPSASPDSFFACPACQTALPLSNRPESPVDELPPCPNCGARWACHNGIYDFKEPQA